jgi:hypothetical protein
MRGGGHEAGLFYASGWHISLALLEWIVLVLRPTSNFAAWLKHH